MNLHRSFGACFVALACVSVGNAANDVWDANGAIPPNGIWGTAANWADNTVPGGADTVTFNITGPNAVYSVTFNANPAAIQDLAVTNSVVTFLSSGGTRSLGVTAAGSGQDVVLNSGAIILGTAGNPMNLFVGGDLAVNDTSFVHVKHGSHLEYGRIHVPSGGQILVEGSILQPITLGFTSTTVGDLGGTGTLTFRGSAYGDLGNSLAVGVSSSATGIGQLDIESGADVFAGFLNVGTGSAGGGAIDINGNNSSLTLYTNANLTVGSAAGGIGTINIGTTSTGGTLTTGSVFAITPPTVTINATGTINIGSGANIGQFVANSNVNINGGTLTRGAGSTFSSRTLTISNGGRASFTGDASAFGTITGAGSTLETLAGGNLSIGSVSVLAGGTISSSGDSTLSIGATASVAGAGSAITLAPGRVLTIAGTSFSPSVINLNDDGAIIVGSGGTTNLNAFGTLNIDGGSADLQTLNRSGGTINFVSGSLSYIGDLAVADDGLLGDNLTLASDRQLSVAGTTTIDDGETLTLAGGTLNVGGLVIGNGTFNFIAGTLSLNAFGGSVSGALISDANTTILVNADDVSLGDVFSHTGFQHQGVLLMGNTDLTLNSAAYARLGAGTAMFGGTIYATNGVSLGGDSTLLGFGTINSRMVGELGSVIEANGGAFTLGDAASPAGFNFAGELRVRQHTVTLRSSAQSALGNLTTLGNGGTPGTLVATNGAIVDFGDAITGFGTINSTNTLGKRTIINGVAQGNSMAQPLTFTGYVKGVGTFNYVTFTGTFDPGLSATISTVGNLAFSPTSTLIMELGGTTPGSGYDQIQASGTLGLEGTLAVTLINGFNPAAGNVFNLFDWTGVTGTFDAVNLPSLGGSLAWDTSQLYTSGLLSVVAAALPGDYNQNGVVDAADYTVWRDTLGSTTNLAANGNGNTAIDAGDYDVWKQNFGAVAGSGAGDAAVPEPTSAALLALALVAINLRRSALSL
ncbi:MAG: PEP-CTERM sorting domain-containing protein [Pirellulales bacterium]